MYLPLTDPQIWKACYTSIESRPTTVMLTHHATQFNTPYALPWHSTSLPPTPRWHQLSPIWRHCPHHGVTSYNTTTCFETVSFKFSIHVFRHCHHHSLLIPPQSKLAPGNCLCLQHLSTPSHSAHYITAYLVKLSVLLVLFPKLTVNLNPSCAVFQVHVMNQCPLICASSSWLHDEKLELHFRPINDCFC